MRITLALLASLLLLGCGAGNDSELPPLSAEDAAYLALDTEGRAERIAGSSPERKFELLIVQWRESHPRQVYLTGDLFMPHFADLRRPVLDYLSGPDPNPDVLYAIINVAFGAYQTGVYDSRGDEELKLHFADAVRRISTTEVGMGGVMVLLPAVWPDEFPDTEEQSGSSVGG